MSRRRPTRSSVSSGRRSESCPSREISCSQSGFISILWDCWKSRSDRAALAASFAEQLMGLDGDQLDYKGLTADRDRLVEALRGIAEA